MITLKSTVICLSGLDPTGGAGISADIEAVAAAGSFALPVVTALTVQDTSNVHRVVAIDAILLREQLAVLSADCAIAAVKIGLIAAPDQLEVIAAMLDRLAAPGVPLVVDPILRAGGGAELPAANLQLEMARWLFPRTTVLTPNAAEARRLVGSSDLDICGEALLASGCASVLITGGDEAGTTVTNRLYRHDRPPMRYEWPRLEAQFHGAGCTLAASIAAFLAQDIELEDAVRRAQRVTFEALEAAQAIGRGRLLPNRLAQQRQRNRFS